MATSISSVQANYQARLAQLGKAALHALYPNDFEYYSMSLELVDFLGNTVDYFTFPILPSNIDETTKELTNVRKTMTGVNVLKNPTFVPHPIVITGDFGKMFKVIINGQAIEFAGLSISSGHFSIDPLKAVRTFTQFSSFAKTGYGCIKVLEAMKQKSKQLDTNFKKPYSLYFYNPIFGNNYQVEFDTFKVTQNSKERNMIPGYTMQLTAVAPLDSLLSRTANLKSSVKNLAFSSLQKSANSAARNLRGVI
jgi:hypothetical protein